MSVLDTIAALVFIGYGFVGVFTAFDYLRARTKTLKGSATITVPATSQITRNPDGSIVIEPRNTWREISND